ncbi:MAG: hypothetical protein R3C10_18880 [Pirellulales bacterium]
MSSDRSKLADRLQRQEAAAALRKLTAGEKLTKSEQQTLRRYEKQQEEDRRWQYYASIPQKHWRQMSGRQTKVINEQAKRYGIPFGGASINLADVVRALHDFLAENAWKLSQDEALLAGDGSSSPALERYREERALLARLDRLEREEQLVARDQVREGLARIAGLLRTAGETLERRHGAEAADVLREALEEAEREITRQFGEASDECDNRS